MTPEPDIPSRHAPNITDIMLWALLGIISWNVTTAIVELKSLREDFTDHVITSSGRLSSLESSAN